MKTSMYGQISLTKLGEIAKHQPDLVKEVTFKDGHKEKFLNISILVNDEPNKYGKIGAVRVDCKRDQQQSSLNYWIADLKPSTPRETAKTPSIDEPLPPLNEEQGDLPF